ncbi:unnamed protein product [Angiostrongylus costaricensis]|uniref:Uncharacterized protein n=1 Tax=Angiostrongylus costaricensis TaxID=334426 RepID=A0A158PL09_ANGCS|nr:unnamed protein product [Angiostrongylus costaricensis]
MVSFWLDCLSSKVEKWLVSWNLNGNSVPNDLITSAAELLNMNVLRNIINLAHDELSKVRDAFTDRVAEDRPLPIQEDFEQMFEKALPVVNSHEKSCEDLASPSLFTIIFSRSKRIFQLTGILAQDQNRATSKQNETLHQNEAVLRNKWAALHASTVAGYATPETTPRIAGLILMRSRCPLSRITSFRDPNRENESSTTTIQVLDANVHRVAKERSLLMNEDIAQIFGKAQPVMNLHGRRLRVEKRLVAVAAVAVYAGLSGIGENA